MSSPEQAISQNDLKQSYLLRLQTLAQEQAFWLGMEGVVVTGYAASIGRQVMAALSAGLTSEEILTALQVGEQRSLSLPSGLSQTAEDDLPTDYWQIIQAEAEDYWNNR